MTQHKVKKNVLGIVAGPRKGQTTDRLANMALKGAEDSGAVTEKIYLYDLNIKPCMGCNKCEESKKCIITDDHQMILDKMDESDIVIFSSPTYFSNVTSVAKAFIDRSGRFFTITKLGPKRFIKKPGRIILITACAAPFPFSHIFGFSTGCINAMKAFFKKMNAKIEVLTATGIIDFNEKKCRRYLKKAYKLGKNSI